MLSSHFTDEETEVQRSYITCTRLYNQKVEEGSEPRSAWPGLGCFLNTCYLPVIFKLWKMCFPWGPTSSGGFPFTRYLRWESSLKALCECTSLGTRKQWDILSSNVPPHQARLCHRPEHGLKTLAWSLTTELISIPINFHVCTYVTQSCFPLGDFQHSVIKTNKNKEGQAQTGWASPGYGSY